VLSKMDRQTHVHDSAIALVASSVTEPAEVATDFLVRPSLDQCLRDTNMDISVCGTQTRTSVLWWFTESIHDRGERARWHRWWHTLDSCAHLFLLLALDANIDKSHTVLYGAPAPHTMPSDAPSSSWQRLMCCTFGYHVTTMSYRAVHSRQSGTHSTCAPPPLQLSLLHMACAQKQR
jgi:hypothetical protein